MSNQVDKVSDLIIIDGPPGSGKGYISGGYIQNNSLTQHISAGDLVRGIRSGAIESRFTPIVMDCFVKKELLPDEVFGDILIEKIAGDGVAPELSLVDGFPQRLGDFERVQDRLAEANKRILGAISLEATMETSVARMAYRGVRAGEEARRQHVFLEDADDIQYFKKRYLAHQRLREEVLFSIFKSKNLNVEHIDVNPDILVAEYREKVQNQFAKSIANLRAQA